MSNDTVVAIQLALVGLGLFITFFSLTAWGMSNAQRKRNEKQVEDIAKKVVDKIKERE